MNAMILVANTLTMKFQRPVKRSIPYILSQERIEVPQREITVRKVPVGQELNAAGRELLLKGIAPLLQECGKDVGTIRIDAVESDNTGKRFIRIMAEVS